MRCRSGAWWRSGWPIVFATVTNSICALGEGDFDFPDLFRRLEAKGFKGHYMNAFGSLEDMLEGEKTSPASSGRGRDA